MTYLTATNFVFSALLLYSIYHILSSRRRNGQVLPPGPRRLPFVGNALQMPQENLWLQLAEWKKKYGNIIHLDIFGQHMVVIGSAKVAKALLDKKGSIYSDRPQSVMLKLCGYFKIFALQSHNETWRKQRRLVAHDFSIGSTVKYYALQEKEAAILVRNLLRKPDNLMPEIQMRLGTIIMRVTYGYQVKSADDPMLAIALQSLGNFSKISTPGAFLVDQIPALQYLPRWMPGAEFLNKVDKWSEVFMDSCWVPYQWSKRNIDTGKALLPNLCASIIQSKEEPMSDDEEAQAAYATGSILGGGLDTNMSSVLSFLMAMILYPEVQAKAQAELDQVVGRERLPELSDRANLPYLRSIMAEVLRWSPAAPLGIPHALSKDDVYDGYFLPKGAVVIPNIWEMSHDPEVYPDPMVFKPERFNGLDSEMAKASSLAFGFGRRICPGMHFAEGTLLSVITTTLATCDVLAGLDENGKEVKPKYAYTSGTISFPEAFPVRLRPRSVEAAALLAQISAKE